MNFTDFYTKIENRLTDAILSLWATGDREMQNYYKYLLEEEPILADVVFQSTFPWEPYDQTFENTHEILGTDIIDSLDNIKDSDFRFPRDRFPYKHQVVSWKSLLNKRKSIVVTTGTGSGKTECFMIPVLNDIYYNSRNSEGVNAIFLYPLNALIASQKKRMHAWCSALGGINYALLTGGTKNTETRTNRENALPELISRDQIRNSPPQILFTNPTMLEYMLVRNADAPILAKSQGKLRWILLDEAHTLTGSKAAEMALLIRRVVTAFGVDVRDLRFAITSATVGTGNKERLRKFTSDLCGIKEDQVVIVEGTRVNNNISQDDLFDIDNTLTKSKIHSLRNEFLKSSAITQTELCHRFQTNQRKVALNLMDKLSDQKVQIGSGQENLLPLRGHFFTRGIGGVYVCTNPDCNKHGDHRPQRALGTMYTVSAKDCSCGYPLLELVACRSCGSMMLEGDRIRRTYEGQPTDMVVQNTTVGYDAFQVETEYDDTEDETLIESNSVHFIVNREGTRRNNDLLPCSITQDSRIDYGGGGYLMTDNHRCPHCNAANAHPMHFRISSAFTNRVLSDIILDQTPDSLNVSENVLYKGKKYISFTDSRQGTAKISALINIDNETNWIRYQVYHHLLSKFRKNESEASVDELHQERAYQTEQLEKAPPFLRRGIQDRIEEINRLLNQSGGGNLAISRTAWQEIVDQIKLKSAFKTLFKKAARGNNLSTQNETYAKSLLFDQMARRVPRERSLENLGLVNLVYPSLDNVAIPNIAEELGLRLGDWKSLLNISVDFVLRYKFHFFFDDSIRQFSSRQHRSYHIYPADSDRPTNQRWPNYNPRSIVQNRLVLLLCAGLGWHERDDVTAEREDQLNTLLTQVWNTLSQRLLTRDGEGFKLNLLEKSQFQLGGKQYLCPVTNRLINQLFMGYSPWIKGHLTPQNIGFYRIVEIMRLNFHCMSIRIILSMITL
jgi:DEAD/DEAH box helicase domain-containing protein